MTTLAVSVTEAEVAYGPAQLLELVTGVGSVQSASAVARELAQRPEIDLAANVGSARSLHDHHAGLHEVGCVLNDDLSSTALWAVRIDPREWPVASYI